MKEKFLLFWEHFKEKCAFIHEKIEFQEEVPENDIEAYKVRIRNHRKAMYVRTAFIVIATVLLIMLARYLINHHTYSGYSVISSSEKTDNVSEYQYVDGHILRYSSDGASLLDKNLDSVWNLTYSMTTPKADVCGQTVAVYDKDGTTVFIYNEKEQLGTFTADYPIVKARVSSAGNVAAILSDGNNVRIVYYSAKGSKIAEISATLKDSGYPTDLALSPDGLFLSVSYLTVNDNTTGTHLAFYNFGEAGKNADNNLVASEDFAGTIIPQLVYVSDDEAVAFRENGFTIYKGSGTPKKTRSVDFEDDIVSTFYDSDHLGFVFKSTDSAHKYVMKIYSINGALLSTTNVYLIYDHVEVCGDHVLFYNSSELAVFSLNGIQRFLGVLNEGDLTYVLKTGMNRYLVVTDVKTETVKLT